VRNPPFGWFPHWVLRDPVWKTLTPAARLVYFRICDQAEHKSGVGDVARSATRYIASLEELHHDTVRVAILSLLDAGLIEMLSEPKRGRIPTYRITRFRTHRDRLKSEMTDSSAISDDGFTGHLESRDDGLEGHIEEPSFQRLSVRSPRRATSASPSVAFHPEGGG
jgi:DNA-binding transcriptional ArsR family regulator